MCFLKKYPRPLQNVDLIKIGINPKHKYTYIYEYFVYVYFIHIPVELVFLG